MIRADIYVQALQLVNAFWEAMDRSDYPAILDMLTDDCRWLRDRWRVGHDDIGQSLQQRPQAVTRHLVTNLIAEEVGSVLDCRHAVILFTAPSSDGQVPPYQTTGPLMADYSVKLALQNDVWKFAELRLELMFIRAI